MNLPHSFDACVRRATPLIVFGCAVFVAIDDCARAVRIAIDNTKTPWEGQ